jgi:hypothetical protein
VNFTLTFCIAALKMNIRGYIFEMTPETVDVLTAVTAVTAVTLVTAKVTSEDVQVPTRNHFLRSEYY